MVREFYIPKINGLDNTSNLFIGNSTYLYMGTRESGTIWTNLIRDVKWYYGDLGYEYGKIEANDVYEIETGQTATTYYDSNGTLIDTSKNIKWQTMTTTAKIGLMYLHDYYWTPAESISCRGDIDCLNSWMNLSHNGNVSNSEWILTRVGRWNDKYTHYVAWAVSTIGSSGYTDIGKELEVRPVFYLKSFANITYDNVSNKQPGSSDNPFIVTPLSVTQ